MKTKIIKNYFIVGILSVVALVSLYYFITDKPKISTKEIQVKKKTETNQQKIKDNKITKSKQKEILPNQPKPKTSNIRNYKDIFKEPKQIDTLERLRNEKELKELEDESSKIIDEAEALIKKHNLKLPQKQLSQEELEKIEQFKQEMDQLQNQLQELENAN
jgi:hypothetical protein